MRDLLPIICSGQASKGGRIQLIHGSSQGEYDPGHPTVGGRPPPTVSPIQITFELIDHARGYRAERDGSMELRSLARYAGRAAAPRHAPRLAGSEPSRSARFPSSGRASRV